MPQRKGTDWRRVAKAVGWVPDQVRDDELGAMH